MVTGWFGVITSRVEPSGSVSSVLAFAPGAQTPANSNPKTKTDDLLENRIQAF